MHGLLDLKCGMVMALLIYSCCWLHTGKRRCWCTRCCAVLLSNGGCGMEKVQEEAAASVEGLGKD